MDHAGVAVGVDIGGTKLAAGLVDADGSVLARLRRDTPAGDADAIVKLVVEAVEELTPPDVGTPVPVGLGAAGLIDLDGVVRYAPNVAWVDEPLRDRIREHLGRPITLDNDANVAAWGEFRVGAGKDADLSMLMLTLGTGVGGGLVIGGELLRGRWGFGGELGHLIVLEGGPPCPCGNRGCLEALASGTAIGRRAAEGLEDGTAPADSALRGFDFIDGKAVTLAARAGDAFALQVLADTGRWLGVGMAGLVNALDPEVVVVGGGAMQAGDLILAHARTSMASRLIGRGHRPVPPVVRAELGDDAGFVGAALLALAPQDSPRTPHRG